MGENELIYRKCIIHFVEETVTSNCEPKYLLLSIIQAYHHQPITSKPALSSEYHSEDSLPTCMLSIILISHLPKIRS